ncbi:GNAT family N-acetyltransferase [[Pasteurella] aerogenes]
MWHCKPFNALTTTELFRIYQVRVAVFVVEQACAYPEVDEKDLIAQHLFYQENGKILAYARIIPSESAVHFGRVLVIETARHLGLGRQLIEKVLTEIQRQWSDKPIHIQAQTYLRDFYASFGFQAISEAYLEDGIPHIDMEK